MNNMLPNNNITEEIYKRLLLVASCEEIGMDFSPRNE